MCFFGVDFLFDKIKAVVSKMAKTILSALMNARKSLSDFFVKTAKRVGVFINKNFISLKDKTQKFIKVNIAENFLFGMKAIKGVAVSFFTGLFGGGFKRAANQVREETQNIRKANPGSFKRLAVLAASFAMAVICLVSVVFWNCNTVAVSVITNGQTVGYVTNSSEYGAIMSSVTKLLVCDDAEQHLSPIEFGFAVVPNSKISRGEDLGEEVLDAQEGIVKAYGLYVEGQFVTCASSEQVIKAALDLRKSIYVTEDTETVSILENIEIKSVYYPCCGNIDDVAASKAITDEEALYLSIQTTSICETVKRVDFNTVIREDSSKVVGYNRIYVKGKDGSSKFTERLISVNGEQVSYEVLAEEVIDESVDQVIVKGTSTKGMSTVQKTLASKGISFLWPIASTEYMYVSSVWGDGRNHQGIDITGDRGTPIYASYEGTVSYAGWSGDYGYLIVIDHKGGYQTAYAHMSAIYVKVGQKVETGEIIAGCGSTGIATGDHVHFEVRIGGVRVNPAPYIGL